MDKYYPIVVLPLPSEEGGGYIGLAIDLVGCISHGETPEEAFASAREASAEWVEEARESKRHIPEPGTGTIVAQKERSSLRKRLEAQTKQIARLKKQIEELVSQLTELTQNDPETVAVAWASSHAMAAAKLSEDDLVH